MSVTKALATLHNKTEEMGETSVNKVERVGRPHDLPSSIHCRSLDYFRSAWPKGGIGVGKIY